MWREDAARTYTWEEISWITGLSIHDLREMFSAVRDKGQAAVELPARLDANALEMLTSVPKTAA